MLILLVQLFMADLAGSEDVRKSKVEGVAFSEAAGYRCVLIAPRRFSHLSLV